MKKQPNKVESGKAGVLDTAGGILIAPGLPDRVWFSAGLTIQPRQFESVRVDAGMSSDVRPEETVEQALERCRDVATHEIETQAVDIRSKDGNEPVAEKKGRRPKY